MRHPGGGEDQLGPLPRAPLGWLPASLGSPHLRDEEGLEAKWANTLQGGLQLTLQVPDAGAWPRKE